MAGRPPQEYSFNKFTYTLSGGEATVTGYPVKEEGDLVIPPLMRGYPVVAIGNYAFSGCSKLTSAKIPSSVKSIGNQAFKGCAGLTTFVVPPTIESIDSYAFYECSGLTSVVIHPGVSSIGTGAFNNCDALPFIWIPATVSLISGGAFEDCDSLKMIQVDQDNPNYTAVDGILFNKDQTVLLSYPAGLPRDYSIPASVVEIGDRAFSGFSRLRRMAIPSGVTRIGTRAFLGCSNLTEILLPPGISSINKYTFAQCTSLKEIRIPAGVKNIKTGAFTSCTSLAKVEMPQELLSMDYWAFADCRKLARITIPDGVTTIRDYTFTRCEALEEVVVGSGTTKIGSSAFSYCHNLASIKFRGDEPRMPDDEIYEVPTDLRAYYYQGAKGFAGGHWGAYRAIPVGPEIAVQQPAGANLTSGISQKSFGTATVGGASKSRTFTIKNNGLGKLADLDISLVGGDSSDFTVTPPSKTVLAPGEKTTFKATFSPKKGGDLSSSIRVSSNDLIQEDFVIEVSGIGMEP